MEKMELPIDLYNLFSYTHSDNHDCATFVNENVLQISVAYLELQEKVTQDLSGSGT